ncbi:putative oligoribonuclease, partial [Xylocopa sonorina]|uniref:putative oligoribonuclease n=1 Tax=Xylocopa sonorina TaxID=1818115 RepID=UPI00403A883F
VVLLQLTGIDIEKDTILEVACVITDQNLKIVSEEFNVVINQPDEILANMNEWNTNTHNESGLVQESRSSKISLKKAEQLLLTFLKAYIPKNTCPLSGNTIYMDRLFLIKHMPLINHYLHYRIIDVSSVKELVRRWYPQVYANMQNKQLCHRALPDIRESIEELRYYKENIFVPSIV